MPNVEFLRTREAARFLGVGRTKFWSLAREPDFPRPVVLGPRLRVWPRKELEAWAMRRRAGS